MLDEVTAWLAEHTPESGAATIVHGDYRLGNVMFAPGAPPRLVAIFDWELATIGDPLADVGYLVATWAQPGDPRERDRRPRAGSPAGPASPRATSWSRATRRAPAARCRDVRWYMTLALWKSAVFLEGSYKRRLAGTTDDAFFDQLEHGVPEVAERAWRIAQEEE